MKYTSRKLLAILLACAIALSCGVIAFAEQQAIGVAAVVGSDVCIRSSASDSGSAVAALDNGMLVSVLEQSDGWYQICYNGKTGYVPESCLEDQTASDWETTGIVIGSDVSIRDTADVSGKRMGSADSEMELPVIGFENGWFAVTYADKTGYIRSDFMTLNGKGTPSPEVAAISDMTAATASAVAKTAIAATATISAAAPAAQKGTVTGSEVHMRAQANTDCEILTDLSRGDSVTILQKLNGWYKVTFGGKTGYVSSDFVTPGDSAPAVTTAKIAAPAAPAKAAVLPSYDTKVKSVGLVSGDSVRMRSESNTSSSAITTLSRGTAVSVLDSLSGWYKVNYNGKDGYISADYLDVKSSATDLNTYGIVKADNLNIRSAIGTSASVVTTARNGVCVDVTGFEKGWFTVKYNNKSGYVSGDYLTLTNSKPAPVAAPAATTAAPVAPEALPSDGDAGSGSGTGYDIVATAQQYLGVPYVYGGASSNGFDCSGFTMYVYKQYGYSLPHGATPQLNYGSSVSQSELQPGDLVFFTGTSSTSSIASHVGIYIGNGQFIHASSGTGYCVKISSLNENYYTNHYLTGRHIA